MIHLTDGTFYSPTSVTDLLHHHRQDISSLLLSFPRQGWSLFKFFFFNLYISKQHLIYFLLDSECVFMSIDDIKSCSHIFHHSFEEFRSVFCNTLKWRLSAESSMSPPKPQVEAMSRCSQRHSNLGLSSTQELLLLSDRKTELHLGWHVFRHILKQKHAPKTFSKTIL